ncbi:MAG TPA: NAD(P)H-binding protein [Terriglobales bacterium]|nr:NAD(P)H-binding protein [Terriglobales bacterium]
MVKVILLGATGMVGQGVLRECLLDPEVEIVLTIGRNASQQHHQKMREIVHTDLSDLSAIEGSLSGYDACFFCLGVSAAGMSEEAYRRVTYDLTISVATTLAKLNPKMTFIYVSGAGTDGTERGRMMWARVKGETENALLQMPFRVVYMFRPGYIQPLHGIRTKTRWYRAAYALVGPFYPLWKRLFPKYVTTTECVGRAMLNVAKRGAPRSVLENQDINNICRNGS